MNNIKRAATFSLITVLCLQINTLRHLSNHYFFNRSTDFLETLNVTNVIEISNGTNVFEKSNGTNAIEISNGTNAIEKSNGTNAIKTSNRTNAIIPPPPKPKLVYLGTKGLPFNATSGRTLRDSKTPPPPSHSNYQVRRFDTAIEQTHGSKNDCIPYEWQTQTFPTCNTIHEIDVVVSSETNNNNVVKIASGGIRDVWRVTTQEGNIRSSMSRHNGKRSTESVVLKTLKNRLNFEPLLFEMHRKDALAMERLTSSPHIINIYGYCGQSVLNESIHSNSKQLRRIKPDPIQKLRFAMSAARALADTHGIDIDGESEEESKQQRRRRSLVHGDITCSNFVLSDDGTYLRLNDFNQARFLTWNDKTNSPCGFRDIRCNGSRSPEECTRNNILSEKTDVYALGHIFYFILTSHLAYRYPTKFDKRNTKMMLTRGETTPIPPEYENSNDPSILAILRAMNRTYTFDPEKRPSAREIAKDLEAALVSIEE